MSTSLDENTTRRKTSIFDFELIFFLNDMKNTIETFFFEIELIKIELFLLSKLLKRAIKRRFNFHNQIVLIWIDELNLTSWLKLSHFMCDHLITHFYLRTYFDRNIMTIITCLFNRLWARVNVNCLWLSRQALDHVIKEWNDNEKTSSFDHVKTIERIYKNRSSISRESTRQ